MADKSTPFTWSDLRALGKTDSAGRWHPSPEVAEYFRLIRAPSRAWPSSYAHAAQTIKFRTWYASNIEGKNNG